MASKLSGIELTRYDDLFKTDAEREADRQERIQIVPAAEVFPYSRQPYTIDRPTPDLVRLMDSIEHIGIAEPLIVRPRDAGGYEIISGHRRDYCAKAVGLDTRPVIVRNYSDEEADILVVDYNINREDLLPSEKAKAYKLKLDAMKRQGQRTDLTSAQVGQKLGGRFSVELLAEQVNESRMQIQRYVRLNKLIPPLLDAVDAGTLKFVPAADFLSHLSEKEQTYLLLVMERDEVSPSLGQAQRLKQLSAEGKLENNIIDLIMREEKPLERKVTMLHKINVTDRVDVIHPNRIYSLPAGEESHFTVKEWIISRIEFVENEIDNIFKYYPSYVTPELMKTMEEILHSAMHQNLGRSLLQTPNGISFSGCNQDVFLKPYYNLMKDLEDVKKMYDI